LGPVVIFGPSQKAVDHLPTSASMSMSKLFARMFASISKLFAWVKDIQAQ
jgi:hypothetical protein